MGLRLAFDDLPGVRLVGEGSNGEEAVALCEELRPDVVIMDIRMPGKSGIETCREILSRWPQTNVIMLTSYADDNLIDDAIQAGATGYVLKDVGTEELIRALDAVRQGAASLDPAVTRSVMAMMRQKTQQINPFRDLTERQLDVLYRVSQGKTNAEIGEELSLSEKTVRNHISAILEKLELTNRVQAATFAVQSRIQDYL
jgi:DNA-binding NarL/FixJ family response regulator